MEPHRRVPALPLPVLLGSLKEQGAGRTQAGWGRPAGACGVGAMASEAFAGEETLERSPQGEFNFDFDLTAESTLPPITGRGTRATHGEARCATAQRAAGALPPTRAVAGRSFMTSALHPQCRREQSAPGAGGRRPELEVRAGMSGAAPGAARVPQAGQLRASGEPRGALD